MLNTVTNPLYLSAVFYWLLSRVFRVQVHKVLIVDFEGAQGFETAPPGGFALMALRHPQALAVLAPSLEAQLDEESGLPCRVMVEGGDRVYAIVDQSGSRVACQLNLRKDTVVVDSPTDLLLALREGDLFLNYLHTRPEYRGRGLATRLIGLACADAEDSGAKRCFAHVRATNFASLGAFRRSGWTEAGRILTTRSGRFIAAPGCAARGLTVRPITADAASV